MTDFTHEENFARWKKMLELKEITKWEYDSFVNGELEEIEMERLKKKGTK